MFSKSQKNMGELIGNETKILEEHHFIWKIENFANIRNSKEALESQKVYFSMGSRISLPTVWYIHLTLKECSDLRGTRVVMYIALSNKPDDYNDDLYMTYQYTIKVKNGKGIYRQCQFGPLQKMELDKPFAYGYAIVSESQENSDLPLTDDGSLILEINVKLYVKQLAPGNLSQLVQTFCANSIKKLQSDLANMLLQNVPDCPTKIICKDGVELAVNRGILSARSQVFLRMFQDDMKEAKTGVVEVKEISSGPMKVLLHFLYTGVLQDNWSSPGIIEELLYAAGKYEQDDLVKFMDPMLVTVCTEENVGKLRNLAGKLNMKQAEKDLFKFIKEHGIIYDKMEGMMKDAISCDWYLVPLADDVTSTQGECNDDKVNE